MEMSRSINPQTNLQRRNLTPCPRVPLPLFRVRTTKFYHLPLHPQQGVRKSQIHPHSCQDPMVQYELSALDLKEGLTRVVQNKEGYPCDDGNLFSIQSNIKFEKH